MDILGYKFIFSKSGWILILFLKMRFLEAVNKEQREKIFTKIMC